MWFINHKLLPLRIHFFKKMNENERIQFDEEDIGEVVNRFKRSLVSGRKKYFDVSEFECIVEQLLEEGDLKSSEIAVMQGIQIHPNAVPLHLKYAQVLLNKEKFEDAIKCLSIVERIEPTNPDVHFIKGNAWLAMDRRTDALKAFGNAIKYAGSEIDNILYHIGLSFIQSGDSPRAIHYFERVLRINPEDEMTLCELGFIYDQIGNFSKSIEYYNRLIDVNPYNYSSWFNLGITYNKAGNHDEAIKAYEFALVANEEFHQALLNIANVFANVGKYNEAIEKYKEYLKLVSDDDYVFCCIGECYFNIENYVKSKKYYHKAIELNANNDTAWFGVGLVMWEERQYKDSITFINNAIGIDETNSEYWHALAKVYSDFNHKTDAVKALKKAVKLELDNSEIWLTWVDIYLNFKEIESAVKILKTAIKKNSDVILKYRLVGLLLENKRNEEAFEMLDLAMKQDFIKVNHLFEFYPKASKNRQLKKRIDEFIKNK
jgi:tetratricopeptide (TPR) repeat protein